jgi:hypothetical protein
VTYSRDRINVSNRINMKSMYRNPEKKMKTPPMMIMRFRDRANKRRFNRKIKIKKAQGLKLSNPARMMVNTGRE